MKKQIPMSMPDITAEEVALVNKVLHTPYLSMGPYIAEFEKHFAEYIGSRYAIAITNGTAGLHLCIIAAGVEKGDLVITTPFSFVSSANVILYEKGIPIFIDIDPKTGNINPTLVAEAVENIKRGGKRAKPWLPPALRHARTGLGTLRAILPVHVFGQPADLDPIISLAQQFGIFIIEDACEAIGAEYKGRKAGSWGDAGVFAFYPNKQMTTGEGGIIVTNREEWNVLFRSLRNQGRDVHDAWLSHTRLGYNYRLDEMRAALGLAQLGRIKELLAKREHVAQRYNYRLKEVKGVETPYISPNVTNMSWFVYVIRLAPEFDRNAVMARLIESGVPCRPYFPPIHLQDFYRRRFGYREGDFPVTEALAKSTLALPFSSVMTEDQVDYVCEKLNQILEEQNI